MNSYCVVTSPGQDPRVASVILFLLPLSPDFGEVRMQLLVIWISRRILWDVFLRAEAAKTGRSLLNTCLQSRSNVQLARHWKLLNIEPKQITEV